MLYTDCSHCLVTSKGRNRHRTTRCLPLCLVKHPINPFPPTASFQVSVTRTACWASCPVPAPTGIVCWTPAREAVPRTRSPRERRRAPFASSLRASRKRKTRPPEIPFQPASLRRQPSSTTPSILSGARDSDCES